MMSLSANMQDPLVSSVKESLRRQTRWRALEIAFWIAAVAAWFVLPGKHLILTEIAIFALLALSIDLIIGFAGIVTLGQAAMYGVGAYASGLFSIHVTGEPLTGLLVAAFAGAAVALPTSFLLLRGADLTRLMVTLGVAAVLLEIANQATWLTGGADGLQSITIQPLFGTIEFDLYGHVGYAYSLSVLFVLFVLAATSSLPPSAIR